MPTRTPVNLGDLAQSFDLLRPKDPATRVAIAEALGFEAIARAAPQAEDTQQPQPSGPPRPAAGPTLPLGPIPLDPLQSESAKTEPKKEEAKTQPILSFDLAGPTKGTPPGGDKPEWWNRITVLEKHVDPAKMPPPDPLLLPIWARTTYIRTLSTIVLEGRLDIPRLVDLVARLEVPAEIPRLPWPTMRNGLQVLVDYGDAMMPFRDDQRRLVREVQELAGGSAFFEVFLFRGSPTRWSKPLITRRGFQAYELPPPGTPILALTDLGIGALAAGQPYVPPEEWLAFARSTETAGCSLTAFVPYALDRCPQLLRGELAIVHWHHARGAAGARTITFTDGSSDAQRMLDDLRQRNEQAAALAHLASLASRVELSLLRELRLTLLPAADGGAEADLWFSPLATVRSEKALLLRPEIAEALRRSLFRTDPGIYDKAWNTVKAYRSRTGAFEGTRLEEEINYLLAQGGGPASAKVEELLRRAVKTVFEQGGQDDEGLALWSVELLDSLPKAARDTEAGRDLGVAAGFRLEPSYISQGVLPDEIGSRQWLIPVDATSLPSVGLWVGREPEGLVLGDREDLISNGKRLDDVPATTPIVLWLSWDDGKRREKVSIAPGRKAEPIPTGEHVVTIETFTGTRWTLTPSTAEAPIEKTPVHTETALDLSGKGLTELPDEVFTYPNLRRLDLSRNQLATLPARIGELAGLEELVLDANRLSMLPPEIGRLVVLQTLSAAGNELEDLPKNMARLKELRHLNLGKNKLAELPSVVGQLRKLDEVSLAGNTLVDLPPAIGRLGKLRRLDVSDNALTGLPTELGKLRPLEELNLRNNRLQTLPPWLDQLNGLRSLDLRGNPLPVAASILEQIDRPQAILAAYAATQTGTTTSRQAVADLEISLDRRSATDFGVELRYNPPGGGADLRVSGANLVSFDPVELLAREVDLAAYGQYLAAQLLAEPEERLFFEQAVAAAQAQHAPLRLRLAIAPGASELHSLRWETLRLPEATAPLLIGEHILFSRYLSGSDWRPVRLRPKSALRALVTIASPSNVAEYSLAEIDTAAELSRIRTGLGDISTVELATRGQATLRNLVAHLREGYDILYLVAHGMLVGGEPWLFLENEDGAIERVSGRELANRIQDLAACPRLAMLVSSQSAGTGDYLPASQKAGTPLASPGEPFVELGSRLAEAGVLAVVAMQSQLIGETAAAFVPAFFRELRRDGLVDRAMAVARGAVRDRPDWWAPVLLMRVRDGRLLQSADEKAPAAKDQSLDELVIANGIDGTTGEYLVPPMSVAELVEIIRAQSAAKTATTNVGGTTSGATFSEL